MVNTQTLTVSIDAEDAKLALIRLRHYADEAAASLIALNVAIQELGKINIELKGP